MNFQNFFGVSCIFPIFIILSHLLRKKKNCGIRVKYLRLDNCEKTDFFLLIENLKFNDIITLVPDLDYGFELRHIFISSEGYAILFQRTRIVS